MEAAFANLEKHGKTDVESLVQWMKESDFKDGGYCLYFNSKVIDKTKEQEEKVRSFFNDVGDKNKVKLDEFKEAMKKVSEDFKKNLDGMLKQLADIGPRMLESVRDGATSTFSNFGGAIKDLMGRKK